MTTSEPLAAPNAALQQPPAAPRRARPAAGRPAALFYSRAPARPLTGCVSALSVCRCASTGYRDALKNYGALCAANVSQPGAELPHDYDALAAPGASGHGCGCLTVELLEINAPCAVGDDEIEHCGYLGWLRS